MPGKSPHRPVKRRVSTTHNRDLKGSPLAVAKEYAVYMRSPLCGAYKIYSRAKGQEGHPGGVHELRGKLETLMNTDKGGVQENPSQEKSTKPERRCRAT